MPKMKIVVPHDLPPEVALARIKGLLGDLKAQHAGQFSELQESWRDNRGDFAAKVMGFNLAGRVEVRPREVEVGGELPFAALPFKGRVEGMVRERLQHLLDPRASETEGAD